MTPKKSDRKAPTSSGATRDAATEIPASHSKAPPAKGSSPVEHARGSSGGRGERIPHESVDLARRPAPGETPETLENPDEPLDAESQSGGRSMRDELFIPAEDDDSGGLPHQREANTGTTHEGAFLPPAPEDEPRSLPRKTPTL